jgi:hypothetical protein
MAHTNKFWIGSWTHPDNISSTHQGRNNTHIIHGKQQSAVEGPVDICKLLALALDLSLSR